jgi:hypothetical protein
MAQRTTPRYFAGRPDAGRDEYPAEIDPTQVIDNFFLGGRSVTEQEWAVTIDPYGRLQGWVLSAEHALAQELQTQLAYADVACDSRVRCLDAHNFYLFHMQLLEQPADAPGLNDPVYLYGTMYGPYPEAGMQPAAGVDGQLTVTRADLLDGIVTGSMFAFRSAPDGGAGPATRTFNVLLPGDRDEEINMGRGMVMMYPLHPAEMVNTGAANEIIVSQLLYDVLSSLKEDITRQKVNNPLRNMVLPVPNRFVMEQDLIAQGYKIKNGVAIRSKLVSTNQFSGVLASVFGEMAADKLELPPEGTVDDLINIARDCIYKLPGWPPPRTVALRNRCRPADAATRARASGAAQMRAPLIHTPVHTVHGRSAVAPDVVSQPPTVRPKPTGQPPAWMQDFMQSHRKDGAPPPRITATQTQAPQTAQTQKKKKEPAPEWMKDFE